MIEDVSQEVTKVIKSIKSTSGKISIKTTTKNSGEKHAYVQGVGVAVTLARPLHARKVGKSKENGKDQASDTYE